MKLNGDSGARADRFAIKDSVFKEMPIPFPNLAEQKKIGEFLDDLTHAISLHQQELTTLKQTKQGFLQKMFPKEGEKVPEVRFPGFTDDWEQRKLGEVVQIVMGQSPNSENYTDNPNDYILVQGNADMKNNRVVPRVWTTQVTKQAEKGDLILSVRAPVGDIGKTDYDVVLGRGVAAIKGNNFIFQQLGKMKENGYWNRYSTGSTFESINSNDIREALIIIPDVKEQQKIGAFFKQLDDTITLHQRELELLQLTKKAFLQKLFV
ncbi:restriction endonuclease subunit S [Enterococcus avium]|nr:restriction endonuclease subunit S [Enterococcus avium]